MGDVRRGPGVPYVRPQSHVGSLPATVAATTEDEMHTRIEWDTLPEETRAAIEDRTGPIRTVRTVSGGRNSPLAVVVHAEVGRVFVKGIRGDHRMVITQHREAELGPHVRPVAPAVLWHLPDAGGWNVLGFEYVEGRHADYAPGSPDLPVVVDVMTRVGEIRAPETTLVRDARRSFASYVDNAELLGGDTLLHTDYNPENVLITAKGTAQLVDWAWPCRGAAWIDPCVLIVRLIAAGHTPEQAEGCVARVPAWQTAPAEGVEAFAAGNVRLWSEVAENDPQLWKHDMAKAASMWCDFRDQAR
jgi:hypothetical protein